MPNVNRWSFCPGPNCCIPPGEGGRCVACSNGNVKYKPQLYYDLGGSEVIQNAPYCPDEPGWDCDDLYKAPKYLKLTIANVADGDGSDDPVHDIRFHNCASVLNGVHYLENCWGRLPEYEPWFTTPHNDGDGCFWSSYIDPLCTGECQDDWADNHCFSLPTNTPFLREYVSCRPNKITAFVVGGFDQFGMRQYSYNRYRMMWWITISNTLKFIRSPEGEPGYDWAGDEPEYIPCQAGGTIPAQTWYHHILQETAAPETPNGTRYAHFDPAIGYTEAPGVPGHFNTPVFHGVQDNGLYTYNKFADCANIDESGFPMNGYAQYPDPPLSFKWQNYYCDYSSTTFAIEAADSLPS